MKIIYVVLITLFFTGCGSSEKKIEDLKMKIDQKENYLSKLSADLRPNQKIPVSERNELEELLVSFYKRYPTDDYAPVCLDKLHMIFSSEGEYIKSTAYGDTLLKNYPDYENRTLILESIAVNYDVFITPRDTSKVRLYYEKLLREEVNLSQDRIEGIKFKLDNIDLTMEELIVKVNEK